MEVLQEGRVSHIYVNPIAECGGVEVRRVNVTRSRIETPDGLVHSTFAIVRGKPDEFGIYPQIRRGEPEGRLLASVEVERSDKGSLLVSHHGRDILQVGYTGRQRLSGLVLPIEVNDLPREGTYQGDAAANWFSDRLGISAALVRVAPMEADAFDEVAMTYMHSSSARELSQIDNDRLPWALLGTNFIISRLPAHDESNAIAGQIGWIPFRKNDALEMIFDEDGEVKVGDTFIVTEREPAP